MKRLHPWCLPHPFPSPVPLNSSSLISIVSVMTQSADFNSSCRVFAVLHSFIGKPEPQQPPPPRHICDGNLRCFVLCLRQQVECIHPVKLLRVKESFNGPCRRYVFNSANLLGPRDSSAAARWLINLHPDFHAN